MKNLFIIDDEKSICNVLGFAFENEYQTYKISSLQEYKDTLALAVPHMVLLDLKLGNVNGLDVLDDIKAHYNSAAVIIMTAYASIESAVSAIKKGAFDYILKPLDLDAIKELLEKAIKYQELQQKIYLNDYVYSSENGIIGTSAKIQDLFHKIARVKNLDVNILIEGESGTGKELVAKAIHFEGNRSKKPFVAINCAAIPPGLIESELFGYEKGAFTGAEKNKKGAFESAADGTIFLDEIGEMDINCQAKLLRTIQNKEILPLGSTEPRKTHARVIAATNKNLLEFSGQGKFREDLYYRLSVFPIKTCPLSERQSDIPMLVDYFIKKANMTYSLSIKGVTARVMTMLKQRQYKGNVRELENIIIRACILCDVPFIDIDCFPESAGEQIDDDRLSDLHLRLGSSLEDMEKQLILNTINYVNGNKAKAAKILGISERSIHYKLRSYLNEE